MNIYVDGVFFAFFLGKKKNRLNGVNECVIDLYFDVLKGQRVTTKELLKTPILIKSLRNILPQLNYRVFTDFKKGKC